MEPRFVGSQRELVAPVDALLVAAVLGLEVRPARDVADIRVGEVPDELAERVGRPCRVRVGESHDVGRGLAHRSVLRGHLAAARIADHPGAARLRELVGAVARSVRGDHDLELLRRVVEGAKVRNAPLDHGLLVVGFWTHDQHRTRRQVQHRFGDRAQQEACDALTPVCADHHQIRAEIGSETTFIHYIVREA